MKKIFFPLMMAFAAMVMLSFSSCQKEDNIRPIEVDTVPEVVTIDLNGTSWEGIKDATYLDYAINLDWQFDFTSETEMDIEVIVTLAGQTATRSTTGTYTFDGTKGTVNFWNKTFDVTYNSDDSTLVVPDLTMSLSDGNNISEVGGETVFHQKEL